MKKTYLLKASQKKDILKAIALIQQGELVAVPTETVYGLAADAKNPCAVQKIFIAKNRPINHPLIVHIASFDKLSEWAKDIPPSAAVLAKHFWPGPLTLLLNKKDSVTDIVTGGLKTIAIRVPQNKTLIKILTQLDTGLAAPSANPHKKISPTTAKHVIAGLSGKIAAVLDAGTCKIGLESTILDLTQKTPRILRPGPITQKMIENVLQIKVDSPFQHAEKISGNMQIHYQPNTKTLLISLDEIENIISSPKNTNKLFGVMHYSKLKNAYKNIKNKKLPKRKDDYARLMYKTLHDLDAIGAHQILVETPPNKASWSDILDRLYRASSNDR